MTPDQIQQIVNAIIGVGITGIVAGAIMGCSVWLCIIALRRRRDDS